MNLREKSKYANKGFTLIELLVVIAIIGILAAVVLASLSSARAKGNDAAVKANLDSMKKQMELYYATTGNYGMSYIGNLTNTLTNCPISPTYSSAIGTVFSPAVEPKVFSALQEAMKNGKQNSGSDASNYTWNVGTICKVGPPSPATTSRWVVAITFKDNQRSWCIDSIGKAKEYPVVAQLAVDILNAKCN